MNKKVIFGAAILALCTSAAYADSFNLSIGGPPAIVEPAPAYVVEPPVQTIVVGGEQHIYVPHHDRGYYNREYWKHHNDHHDDHDHR